MKKVIAAFLLSFTLAGETLAGEPVIWTLTTRADFLRGEAKGVTIASDGTLSVSAPSTLAFDTGQSFIWSSLFIEGAGIFVGTGGEGKIFRIDTQGKGTMFTDLAEMNVSALAAAPQGGLFAATSPDGKVYRIDREGKASIFFEPKEKYIWALAVMKSGELVVATGDAGRIYKVKENSGKVDAKIFYDSSETHIISLATNPSGELFAGTDSGGLVLKFSPEGRPFTMLDSPLREIHSVKVDEEGNVYALAVAESVSAKTEKAETPDEPKSVTAKRTSGIQSEQANKSRYDFSQSKSAVYRIGPDGSTSVIWNSPSVAAFAIEPLGGLGYTLVGTSDRGRVYVVDKDGMRESMVGQLSESQVSGLVTAGDNVVMTTSGQGKVFAMNTGAPTGTGMYQSPVLDAKAVSSWGRLTSRSSGEVAFETRSGNSELPDGTWSDWTAASGPSSPKGRYFQWRVTMKGSATVSEVSLAFVQDNIAPEMLSLNILPTNVGLAPNATVAVDPNIELSGQDGSDFGLPTGIPTPRKLFQRGARSLQWTAEDRNGDKLTYTVRYRRADEGGGFVTVRAGIAENYLTIDGLSLSDGRYIFEVVASDASSNPAGRGLEGSMRSEPIDIDSAAPIVERVGAVRFETGSAIFKFSSRDVGASVISRAEYSLDGGNWNTVYADDGINDGPSETFTVTVKLGENPPSNVVIRVFDRNGNVGTARSIIEIPRKK